MKQFNSEKQILPAILKVFLYSIITLIVLGILYPDRFFFANLRFTSSHTVANFYQSGLFHAQYIKNLNFNFWNFFDQSNTTFYHLAQGFYNLSSLIEGITYNLFSLFRSENFFRIFHSFFIQLFFIISRTIGILLILDLYKVRKYLYLPIILFINVMISSVVSMGYEASLIYSLSPILIYYLINFLKKNNITSLIFFLIFYTFIFSQIPLLSLSYFFPPFHFILFLYAFVVIYNYFLDKNNFEKKYKKFFDFKFNLNIYHVLLLISLFVILLFNFSFFLIATETHSLTGSVGYDGKPVSRFDNILNPIKFFKVFIPNARCIAYNYYDIQLYSEDCSISNWFSYFFNFNTNEWFQAPVFIGFTVILISLYGLIFSRYQEKWYFFFTIIFIIALQGPRDILFNDINFYANLFTAFFNPFAFLIQHTHMIILLAPFLMIPLFIMGSIALFEKIELEKIFHKNLIFLILTFGVLLYLVILREKIGIEVIISYSLILTFIILTRIYSQLEKKEIIISLISICFLIDSYAIRNYFKEIPLSSEKYLPVYTSSSKIKSFIDNPNPFNTNLAIELIRDKPKVSLGKKYNKKDDKKLNNFYFSKNLYIGEFYKTNFLFRLLEDPNIYELRHKSFKKIHEYRDLKYFKKDMILIDHFSNAVSNSTLKLTDYFDNKSIFENNIFISDHEVSNKIIYEPLIDNSLNEVLIKLEKKNIEIVKNFDGKVLYKFEKPKKVPNYINGSIFANSNSLRLIINDKELDIAHDDLFLLNTFNISNTQNDYIHFLIDENLSVEKIELIFSELPWLKDLNRNKDNFTFSLDLEKEGWLLIKFPYDKNWQIFIDGKKAKTFKANGFWIGTKVGKNSEVIEVSYNLDKYGINQLSLILYYLSMIFILVFLFKYNFLIKK